MLILLLSPALFAPAAAPTLDHLYPAGAGPGSTNVVVFSGKFDPWPPRLWSADEGISFLAETNAGRFRIEVVSNAPPGPRVFRLFNDEGASEPRFFVVGPRPELAEVEPNNRFQAGQRVEGLPATINGRLDKNGDVDSFALAVKGGEWLEARVDSYTLLSKIDAVLRLVTTNGQQLAWNHDDIHFDPRVVWQAPRNEIVVVQVFGFRYPADASIQLAGGDGGVYRLHLSATNERPPDLPPPANLSAATHALVEVEPNDTSTNAQPMAGAATISIEGAIRQDRDIDRFSFDARKEEFVVIAVEATGLGSPLDAWCRVEDVAGKELAAVDDSEGSRDPRLVWKAPADGRYVLAVGSTTHRGSKQHRYRLTLRHAEPEFQARAGAGSLTIPADGSTNELKLTIQRLYGHTNGLSARLAGLPEGVNSSAAAGPAGDGEVALKIVAATNAPGFNGPVRLLATDTISGGEQVAPYELVSRGENNGVPQGYSHLLVERVPDLWLTVRLPAVATNATNATGASAPK